MDQLNRLLTQIRARRHKAKGVLDDESYKAILQRCAGVDSSTQIRSVAKAKAILADFDRLRISPPAGQRPALTPIQKKMWSCWQQLADAGLIADRSMGGLKAWIKASYGIDDLQWMTWAQESNSIERMKRWLLRRSDDGFVQ